MPTTSTAQTLPAWLIILLALISLAGVVVGAWFSYKGMIHARVGAANAEGANKAVNDRKPGEDRLFDMVASTRDAVKQLNDWKDRWDDSPKHIADPTSLATHLAVIEDRIKTSAKDTTDRIIQLHSHVDEKISVIDTKVGAITERLSIIESKPEPWDGVTERRKGTQAWDGIDRRSRESGA